MKIISWNLANRVRKQQLQLDALISREPDVIGLQEVTSRTLPLWVEGLKKAGYTYTISSFSLHSDNGEFTGPRRYGILVASRWPLELVDQHSLNIPWHERLVSALVHSPNVDFEFHVAYIPPGSSNSWLKIDTFEGIYKFLAKPSCNYPRILCGDFNSPKAETNSGEVITWGQNILKDGQVIFTDKESRWDVGERSVIQGLAEFNLYDIFGVNPSG